jgi:hypothetical protein
MLYGGGQSSPGKEVRLRFGPRFDRSLDVLRVDLLERSGRKVPS